jgi:hypothetical protein
VYGNFAGSFTGLSVDAVALEAFKKRTNELTLYFVYLGMSNVCSFEDVANGDRNCIILYLMD